MGEYDLKSDLRGSMTWNQIWEGVWPEIKSEGKRLFWEFLFNFSITVKTCNYISYLNHFKGPVTGNNTLIELSNCQSLISFTLLLSELKLYLVNTSPFLRSLSFDCADDFMASGNIWRVLFVFVLLYFCFCFVLLLGRLASRFMYVLIHHWISLPS